MKRTGFKKLSFEEAKKKTIEAQNRRISRVKSQIGSKSIKPLKTRKKKKNNPNITYLGIRGYRWAGYKGVLWTIFSKFIRKRDFIKYKGQCVSCKKILEKWELGDAGHYISVTRGSFLTLFNEKNVALQCKKCNNPKWTPDASIPFRQTLIQRYDKKTVDRLEKLSNIPTKGYSELEYKRQIQYYLDKFNQL